MLKSPAHKPFTLREDVAEELGYLEISDESDVGSLSHGLNEPTVCRAFGRFQLSASEPDSCKRSDCACPRLELTPSQHIVVDPVAELESFTFLDGAAGSTLHGHRADEDDDPENITLSYEKPLPDIIPEGGEKPYVRPPDSSDEDEINWQKGLPKQLPRACDDRAEMRKRFRKGKNRKTERVVRREENIPNSEKYFRPIPQRAERRILDAYAAADERLFGQKRFEELEDEMEVQRGAVASWQEEIGMKATFDDDPKKVADQLSQDIDCFIRDVLSEFGKQIEQERCDKMHKNKMFFEDTLEDVAIDHEFNLADQDQEKLRKAVGKKQNKKLRDLKTEDVVDDIAMDHNQRVGEKEEEHHRKIIGRFENKMLASIRTDNTIDNLAMDHLQQVGEKEEEHHRKTISRIQNQKLTSVRTSDMVDDLAMDHAQEVGEKKKEHHRKAVGRFENKKLASVRTDDTVDNLAMDHLQEVGEKEEEHHRKITGRIQNKKLTSIRTSDMVGDLATDHIQEVGQKKQGRCMKSADRLRNMELTDERILDHVDDLAMGNPHEIDGKVQERCRKTSKVKEVKNEREANSLAMDHAQRVNGGVQDHQREVFRTQPTKKLKLNDGREASLFKPIAISLEKDPEGLTERRHRTRIHKTPLATNIKESIHVMDRDDENNPEQKRTASGRNNKTNPDYSRPIDQTTINNKVFESKQGASSGFEAEAKNNQGDDDGYSSPPPAPKKDRRQLRKEANAKFEAMMEEMLKAQEG